MAAGAAHRIRTRARPRPPPLRTRADDLAAGRRQTILVVEDEPALLRALRINLRARGYEVVTASAGRPALAEATQRTAGRGDPRPRPARPGRHRRDPGAAAWSRPRRSSCCPAGPGRVTRSAPWTRARTTTSPSRSPWRNCWPGCGPRCAGTTRRQPERPVTIGRCTVDLAAHLATRDGPAGPAHPDRVAAAGDPDPPSRPAGRRPAAAHRGVGARPTSRAPTTCASTWPGCAANWRTTRPGPVTC